MAAERKRELLVDELKQTVGEEAVEHADLDVDRALEQRPSRAGATVAVRSSRLLLIVAGAVLLVVGVIASLALENWIFFGAAIAAHALLATVVIASALALATDAEKPAPTAEAALEEEGVSDPGAALGALVEQVESRDSRPS
jgi:Flp pilus assembly protein TadB